MLCHTAYNCNALDTCNFSIIFYHAFYFDCFTIQKVVGFTSQQYLLSNTVGNAAIDFTTDFLLLICMVEFKIEFQNVAFLS